MNRSARAGTQRSAVEQPPARPARCWYIDLSSLLLPDSQTFNRLIVILCLRDFLCTHEHDKITNFHGTLPVQNFIKITQDIKEMWPDSVGIKDVLQFSCK